MYFSTSALESKCSTRENLPLVTIFENDQISSWTLEEIVTTTRAKTYARSHCTSCSRSDVARLQPVHISFMTRIGSAMETYHRNVGDQFSLSLLQFGVHRLPVIRYGEDGVRPRERFLQ